MVWLVFGVVLLLFELHHLAFYAVFGAIGSFAGAIVALFAPSAVGLQAGVAVGLAIVGVAAVRPFVSNAFAHRRGGHAVRGVHGGLIGQQAHTLDTVGDAHLVGHVRLAGERWLAISGGGEPIPSDSTVVVTAVQGTTLVVWPLDGLHGIASTGSDDAPDGAGGSLG